MRAWDDVTKKGFVSPQPTRRLDDAEIDPPRPARLDRGPHARATPATTCACSTPPTACCCRATTCCRRSPRTSRASARRATTSPSSSPGSSGSPTLDGVRNVLPAHGHPFTDLAARTKAIRHHHEERLDHLRQIVDANDECDVIEASHELFQDRSWGAMAESETYAHLEHLVHDRRRDAPQPRRPHLVPARGLTDDAMFGSTRRRARRELLDGRLPTRVARPDREPDAPLGPPRRRRARAARRRSPSGSWPTRSGRRPQGFELTPEIIVTIAAQAALLAAVPARRRLPGGRIDHRAPHDVRGDRRALPVPGLVSDDPMPILGLASYDGPVHDRVGRGAGRGAAPGSRPQRRVPRVRPQARHARRDTSTARRRWPRRSSSTAGSTVCTAVYEQVVEGTRRHGRSSPTPA